MSLQRAHRQGLMKYGAERKMLPEEFWKLVNDSFSFLKVQMPRELANDAIRAADKDGDGMITYVEYFQFIDHYICFRAGGKYVLNKRFWELCQNSMSTQIKKTWAWTCEDRKIMEQQVKIIYVAPIEKTLRNVCLWTGHFCQWWTPQRSPILNPRGAELNLNNFPLEWSF